MANSVLRGVIRGVISNIFGGGGNIEPTCWPEPIGPCSTAMQRYLWEMDGQSMFWRRESADYGQTVNARLRVAFTGVDSGFQYLVGCAASRDRFFISINNGKVSFGNGSVTASTNESLNSAAGRPISVGLGEISTAELITDGAVIKFYVNGVLITEQNQDWSGLLNDVGFGVRFDRLIEFYSGAIYSVAVETDTENDVYPLDGNGPYELPNGVEAGPELPSSTRDFSVGGPWDNGTFTRSSVIGEWSTTAAGIGPRTASDSLLGGDSWFLEWAGLTGSDLYLNVDGALSFISSSQSGSITLNTASATSTAQIYLRATAAGDKTLSSFSLRSLPSSALIRENEELDGSDIILIDRQADNGGWDTVANAWEPAVKAITGSATSSSPTSITIDEVGNNTPLAGVQIFSSGLVGDVIRVTGNATINSGQIDISLLSGLAGVAASITASGPFSFDLDSTGYVGFKRAFAGGADATITNLKVITVLDYADGAVQELSAYTAAYTAEYGA